MIAAVVLWLSVSLLWWSATRQLHIPRLPPVLFDSRCSVTLLWRAISLLRWPTIVLLLGRRGVVVVVLLSWVSRHGGRCA